MMRPNMMCPTKENTASEMSAGQLLLGSVREWLSVQPNELGNIDLGPMWMAQLADCRQSWSSASFRK